MSVWTDLVPLGPSRLTLNGDLHGARNATMLEILGNPRADYASDCRDPTNPRIARLIVREDVGPFKARGLAPAVAALRRIFVDIRAHESDVYGRLGNMGMLCCRFVRGSRSAISNHSWGTAIDLTIDGILDQRGDRRGAGHSPTAQRGLLQIYKHFNRHGFFWGAAFPTEDSMHFEASDQLIRQWQQDGALGDAPEPVTDDLVAFGDRGAAVFDLQRRLAIAVSGELAADGVFGAMTRAAVIEFQHRAGLKANGTVDETTLSALKDETPGA